MSKKSTKSSAATESAEVACSYDVVDHDKFWREIHNGLSGFNSKELNEISHVCFDDFGTMEIGSEVPKDLAQRLIKVATGWNMAMGSVRRRLRKLCNELGE